MDEGQVGTTLFILKKLLNDTDILKYQFLSIRARIWPKGFLAVVPTPSHSFSRCRHDNNIMKTPFLVLILLKLSHAYRRSLQISGASCDEVLQDLREPRYPICSCSFRGSSAAAVVNATCRGCPHVCGHGSCGSGQISTKLEFESDESVIGSQEECFEYYSGNWTGSTVCKTVSVDMTSCSVQVNSSVCTTCEIQSCPNGSSKEQAIVADCRNLQGGELFDFCDPIALETNTTPFIWFDELFQEDSLKCESSGGLLSMVSGFVAVFLLLFVLM